MQTTIDRPTTITFDLEASGVSRHVYDRARQLVRTGAVRLTVVNGMAPEVREVMLAAGVALPPVWFVRAVVRGRSGIYRVEILTLEHGAARAYCSCPAYGFCSHLLAAWGSAAATNGGQ